MNLSRAIAEVAQRRPDAPALISSSGRVFSHAEIEATVGRLAAFLAAQGVEAGDHIGIAMPTSPLHLLTILALARLGAVSLSIPPGQSAATTILHARRYELRRMIGDEPGHVPEGLPATLIERGWQDTVPAPAPIARVAADAPWRIALSSGTTGKTKATLYTHGETLEYARLSTSVTPGGAGPGTRLLCFMGLGAGFTLRPCLRHLLFGGAVSFARSSTPEAMIEALRKSRVTHAVASPSLLRKVCELLGEGKAHFPDLRHLAVGGAALSPALIAQAQARVTPHLYSHYGASEAGLVALAGPEMLRRQPECAGRLMAWIEAEAVDAAGRPLPPGTPGELRFRGPGVAKSFFRDPQASARSFRDGWFHPGDTGRVGAERLLFVDGRTDDRINLNGRKLDPRSIEWALEQHPLVIEAAAFLASPPAARTEMLCAAVVLRSSLKTGVLREHCRRILGQNAPVRYFSARRLPRNANGKLMRRELERALLRPAGRRNAQD